MVRLRRTEGLAWILTVLGIIGVGTTLFFSHAQVSSAAQSLILSPYSGYTLTLKARTGDTIEIRGNASSPIVLLLEPYGNSVSITLGPYNGSFSKSMAIKGTFKGDVSLVLESKDEIARVHIEAIVYNDWFSPLTYALSALSLVTGIAALTLTHRSKGTRRLRSRRRAHA